MAESDADKLGRVQSMASGSETWDLSRNDIAALKYVLAALTAATARAERAEALLREAREWVAECLCEPCCEDEDEAVPREEWCGACDISARIEAHLEGR